MDKFDSDLTNNEFYYYFTFLTDRFITITDIWTRKLSEKFNKTFKPIWILPYLHNKTYKEENYIVLNENLFNKQQQLNRSDVFNIIYPEEMNKQFMASTTVRRIIEALVVKQSQVFVLPFSSVWLSKNIPGLKIIGPQPEVAAFFDEKSQHIRVFNRLGIITNEVEIYANIDELRQNRKSYPFFFSAIFSSGGFESHIIRSSSELDLFYNSLREVNKNGPFLVAKFLNDIVNTPNVSAMVTGPGSTSIICLSDQMLRGNSYMGNIYPTSSSALHQKIMTEATLKIGNYMSESGFRGLFGVDFLITKDGSCYPTDINPRRQGGYFCNVMMSKKVDIVDLELKLALNEEVRPFLTSDCQVDYCWAHHKLAPYYHNIEITGELNIGEPENPFERIGSEYKAIYYPEHLVMLSGNPGFYVTSGYSYEQVKSTTLREVDRIINTFFVRRPDIDELLDEPVVKNKPVPFVTIEPFHETELDAIEEILKEHVSDPIGISWPEINDIKRFMKGQPDQLGRSRNYFIAHNKAGMVLGCVAVVLPPDPILIKTTAVAEENYGEILNLFVSSRVIHGGGVGRKLFESACNRLKSSGKNMVVFDSGIRYKDHWKFFDVIGCERCGIIPDRYGPGWHSRVWKKAII